ncbi:hypothetical protein KC19_VG189900 [Ceratodon purpureus]|uniref:Uncharacterized protein n=1 Tax=Ceratodon purpureus TaxID=3225 RepID=A0A8T0HS53_CERPU|nr:hypothetical protein KC19_VG189900 [Ceratodon purpureus]
MPRHSSDQTRPTTVDAVTIPNNTILQGCQYDARLHSCGLSENQTFKLGQVALLDRDLMSRHLFPQFTSHPKRTLNEGIPSLSR